MSAAQASGGSYPYRSGTSGFGLVDAYHAVTAQEPSPSREPIIDCIGTPPGADSPVR